MARLWETAGSELDPAIDGFLRSLPVDVRLLPEDLEGSLAHVGMLGANGIVPREVAEALTRELRDMLGSARDGRLPVDPDSEDVHSFIEEELTRRLGDGGKSVHAGRSRNDQVAVALRLFLRSGSKRVMLAIADAVDAILDLASGGIHAVMPGYTHLQRAQPVTFAHHLLAWCAGLERDHGRFRDAAARADECPLGSCALAGSGLPVDREATARSLGFPRPGRNTMDAVGDRDACSEFAAACALLMTHCSRFAEEMTLWSSSEFGFVRVGTRASTGSSVMPQKRNPDPAELIRGKAGRVIGSLVALLTMQKGLPYAYDRDLQEDKAAVFDAHDTALGCLGALAILVRALEPDHARMREAASEGFLDATDLAEFLVAKGLPFRTAYAAAKAAVGHCIGEGIRISSLTAAGFAGIHPAFAGVVRDDGELALYLELDACVGRRAQTGGPAPVRVMEEIARLRAFTADARG
ncbi:MAG: argininosuccinate lyase [Spirochaetes bacterium]|nr:argininosuccinate lyase [Spirochaetota bacterium]